jgi:linoleoyl-CoA desaturase
MKSFEKKKVKYKSKDSSDNIYQQIKNKTDRYFTYNTISKYGGGSLWLKFLSLSLLLSAAYYEVLHAHSFFILLISFVVFGLSFLLIGINIGHDAAHNCVTGNKRIDSLLFQLTFGLQGLSGYVWQIRHNFSHHIFPNVYENDTDLELSKLLLLSPKQKRLAVHKYQHLYAPFLYMTFSLSWIFYIDFNMLFKKQHANIKFGKIPAAEILKLILIKLTYIFIFLVLPINLSTLPLSFVLLAYFLMNFLVSLFLAFTFFISHHVLETEYAETHENKVVADSWIHHQIVSTIDFSTNSEFGNYIFGGFNLHIAHHLFPEVSHIHYPALTKIIEEVLEENNLSWYKSFSFMDGVRSHMQLLKRNGGGIFEEEQEIIVAQEY